VHLGNGGRYTESLHLSSRAQTNQQKRSKTAKMIQKIIQMLRKRPMKMRISLVHFSLILPVPSPLH
jgi:hypothetical protein